MSSAALAGVTALPGVESAVAQARVSVDRLLTHRVLRRRGEEVRLAGALRGARASAALDGVDWPLADVRRLEEITDRPGAGVVRGALRTGAELGALRTSWVKAPLQVLARLHALAAADLLAQDRLGRPRASDEAVDDPLGLPAAPSPATVSARLDALARLVASPADASALVLSAVVHGELLALRPFPTGNGVVARAASRLVLITKGFDPAAVTIPEVGHLDVADSAKPAAPAAAYGDAARGYLAGTPTGVAVWVVHCAGAVERGAQEGLAVCEALLRG